MLVRREVKEEIHLSTWIQEGPSSLTTISVGCRHLGCPQDNETQLKLYNLTLNILTSTTYANLLAIENVM